MATTWINRGHMYAPHVRPVVVDCRFTVNSSDSAGLGITGLKGQGVAAVYMHTSATPATGSPNPAAGLIMVKFTDNFSQLYLQSASLIAALSGTPIQIDSGTAGLTVGNIYVITALGTSLAADWLAVGVPHGVTPAVGVAFIALATGAGAGTGAAQAPAATGSGINHVELIGSSKLSLAPIPVGGSPNVGGYIYLACYKDSASDVNALAAPADGSAIHLAFYMNQSSVVVAGE